MLKNSLNDLFEYQTYYSNNYFHDPVKKILHANCATFLKYFLPKYNLPLRACDIFEHFLSQPQLHCTLENFSIGDIILWKKNVVPAHGDSGHVCVIKKIIKKDSKSIRLEVYDFAKNQHDNDSRSNPGFGFGEMELLIEDLKPVGFRWLGKSKKTKLTQILIVKA